MTAHTKGSPSTMAEYEARLGLEEESSLFELQRGIIGVIDTTTLVSLVSSCIVLIAGCIAVGCLILYKRKLNEKLANRTTNHYRKPSSTSVVSSTIHAEETSELLRRGPPGDPRSGSSKSIATKSSGESGKVEKYSQGKVASTSVQQVMRLPPPAPSSSSMIQHPSTAVVTNSKMMDGSSNRSGFTSSASPFRGKLPKVSIPRKQLEQIEADVFNEYEEITPYATFKLHDHDDRDLHSGDPADEEFKTFTVTVGEPAYCFKVWNISSSFRILFPPYKMCTLCSKVSSLECSCILSCSVKNP